VVTAVKIQIVYENPLKGLNPLTAMARQTKKLMKRGPDLAEFPLMAIIRAAIKHTTAIIKVIL
jgi:hypothetical protein